MRMVISRSYFDKCYFAACRCRRSALCATLIGIRGTLTARAAHLLVSVVFAVVRCSVERCAMGVPPHDAATPEGDECGGRLAGAIKILAAGHAVLPR